jgi:DNA repair exonuclease SbcCD nuclease subunit
MSVVFEWASRARVILLAGNHDQHSDQPNDHALAPMGFVNVGVEIVEQPKLVVVGETCIVCVPFRKGPASEWFGDAVKTAAAFTGKREKLLAFHLGVEDSATPHFLQGAQDSLTVNMLADICASHEISAAFAGHWHTPQRWSSNGIEMVQCGAFCPTGWQNEGQGYGFVTIYDTELEQLAIHQVPGPRFETLLTTPDGDSLAKGLFIRVKAANEVEMQAALDWFAKYAPGRGDVRLVAPDDKTSTAAGVVEEGAPTAMFGGAKAEALVHRYIEAMPLAEGVERPVVHGLVRKALFTKGGA